MTSLPRSSLILGRRARRYLSSSRSVARLCLILAAGLLVEWADPLGHVDRALFGLAGPRPAVAATECVPPSEGDVLETAGSRLYVYADGALHAVPDVATLRSLGYDPNGVDPIRDDCLRALPVGDPIPRASAAGADDRTARSRAERASEPAQAGPAVLLWAGSPEVARGARVPLLARADVPDAADLVLSIRRAAAEGQAGASGLVTRCSGSSSCAVEVVEDEAVS